MGRVRILAGCGPAHDLCIVRAPRAGRRGRRPLRRGRGRTRGSDGCAGAAPTVSRLAGDRRKDTSPEGGRQERGADSLERPPPSAASRGSGGCHLPRRGEARAGCGFAGAAPTDSRLAGDRRLPPPPKGEARRGADSPGAPTDSRLAGDRRLPPPPKGEVFIMFPSSRSPFPTSRFPFPTSRFPFPSSLFLLPSGSSFFPPAVGIDRRGKRH